MEKLGCVKYLNARPLIRGWEGPVDFDHPSALCQKLAHGLLDVALVSSIEYLRRPHYRIVDGVSIATDGAVYSVILSHGDDLARLEQIQIDPASETSVALLRCLLSQRGLHPALVKTEATAKLLIGDQAIRFRREQPGAPILDLGSAWKDLTSLPFVFALWLIRPEVKNDDEIAQRLRRLRDENLAQLDAVISEQNEFDPEFCGRYFRENLRFSFGEKEKSGLTEFHRLCLQAGVAVAPALTFQLI